MKEKLLKSLQLDLEGNRDAAHEIVQNMEHTLAFLIHAYLHRKKPDLNNASYWYSKAGKQMPDYSFERERQEIHDFIALENNL